MISVQHNLPAMNANRTYGTNVSSKQKSAEKLSTGYRINRAADDAAGLKISEKMRQQIRGLARGKRNAHDGVSWLKTGDGALQEAHDIVQRMNELAVQSLNDPYNPEDREAMEQEFYQLQKELDRIGQNTQFNNKNIFNEHEKTYYQCEGGRQWDMGDMHVVLNGLNDLVFVYRSPESSPQKTFAVTVPPGEYTTQELLDEIDTVLSVVNDPDFDIEFTEEGYVNGNFEGGEIIDAITGGLSYLLYDKFGGGGIGALIGTTIFPDEDAELKITAGQNDEMTFTIQDVHGGGQQKKTVKIPQGSYNRQQLIGLLNDQLKDTTVKAVAEGTGIMLTSEESIVTGFKGNMFKIDGGEYTSVFYDNVKYGEVKKEHAVFTGGYVLTTDSRDVEHQGFVIEEGKNDVLTLQPNKMPNPVDLKLDPGTYNADEMVEKLNDLFVENGLELTAKKIETRSDIYSPVDYKYVYFEGIQITSKIKGVDSEVNIDETCSAFDTLFKGRIYNQYGAQAVITNETRNDSDAYYSGSKILSGISDDQPLKLNSGKSFSLTLKDTDSASSTTYTITLPKDTYTRAGDIITDINKEIQKIPYYNSKVEAVLQPNGSIAIRGISGQRMDTVSVGTTGAYKDLFVGTSIRYYPTTQTGTGSLTLESDTGKGDANFMNITVDGKEYRVSFDGDNNPDLDKIKDAINDQLKAKKELNKFQDKEAYGSSSDKFFACSGKGSSYTERWEGSAVGNSKHQEGLVGSYEYNNPAVLELKTMLKDQMEIDSKNNLIELTLNGTTKQVKLDDGSYTPDSLCVELQKKIDQEFGTGWGGAQVALEGNRFAITCRLPQGKDGSTTSISCSTDTSSFLSYLNTTKKPAVCMTTLKLDSNITIDDTCNTFHFTYEEGGNSQEIDFKLNPGTYSQLGIVGQINAQLKDKDIGVTASLSNGKLVLTSRAEGSDVSIKYDTTTGGSSAKVLYGKGDLPAEIIINDRPIQSSITIGSSNRDFFVTIGTEKKQLLLDEGTYNRADFVQMLNKKMGTVGGEAFLYGNYLGLRTQAAGSDQHISMVYEEGTSLEEIYGSTVTPGVKAETVGNKIKLTAVDEKGNTMSSRISVSSGTSAGLVKPRKEVRELSPSVYGGYHSTIHSKMDGVDLAEPIEINQWNNDLSFQFRNNGSWMNVNITVDNGTYTYDTLKKQVQEKLDAKVGAGIIKVSVDGGGVVLTAANPGSGYQFSKNPSPGGDFYWKVMCECKLADIDMDPKDSDGTQDVEAYTIGRKNIRDGAEIIKDVSDEFSFDLTYGGACHTISLKLDDGHYSADALISELQKKIDEQLEKEGLKKGLIKAQIGGISSGVAGNDDENALNLSIVKEIDAPAEGEFIIDGVTGGAAFEIFYQTKGELRPAYIAGTKDISQGVEIGPENNELSFKVDNETFHITLDDGQYTPEEIVDEMNQKFDGGGVPLVAKLDEGKVKIYHKKLGQHEIKEVSGSGKKDILFNENGEKDRENLHIQLSGNVNDHIDLPDSVFSSSRLGINTITIGKPRYAEKALVRLQEAVNKISSVRSDMGTVQNRLEHIIANNMNQEENMQAAESRIRDADIAQQVVELARSNILMRVGEAMLAQTKNMNQDVMKIMDLLH